MEEENRLLWVGGIAGFVTGALLVVAFIIRVAAAGTPFGAGLEEQLQQFQEASILAVFQAVNVVSLPPTSSPSPFFSRSTAACG